MAIILVTRQDYIVHYANMTCDIWVSTLSKKKLPCYPFFSLIIVFDMGVKNKGEKAVRKYFFSYFVLILTTINQF